jgi:hypothetical protein
VGSLEQHDLISPLSKSCGPDVVAALDRSGGSLVAKFIHVQVVTERYAGNARDLDNYYINAESISYILQNAHNLNACSIYFIGGGQPLVTLQSAANLVKQIAADSPPRRDGDHRGGDEPARPSN